MMIRRAAAEAVKHGLLVLLAAIIVAMVGLALFNRDPELPEWAWRLAVMRELGK